MCSPRTHEAPHQGLPGVLGYIVSLEWRETRSATGYVPPQVPCLKSFTQCGATRISSASASSTQRSDGVANSWRVYGIFMCVKRYKPNGIYVLTCECVFHIYSIYSYVWKKVTQSQLDFCLNVNVCGCTKNHTNQIRFK